MCVCVCVCVWLHVDPLKISFHLEKITNQNETQQQTNSYREINSFMRDNDLDLYPDPKWFL